MPLGIVSRWIAATSAEEPIPSITYYVALPFVSSEDGDLEPREAVECTSASNAIMRAEALARAEGNAGAVAFSREGDPMAGEFSDAKVLRTFGDVPSDLSSL